MRARRTVVPTCPFGGPAAMPLDILRVSPDRPDPAALERAAAVLRSGGIVGLPTETVYGLAVRADRPESVARLLRIRNSPADKNLTLHVADPDQAERRCAVVPPAAHRLMARFWPGPLTLVLPARGGGEVGLRFPKHPVAAEILRLTGSPVVIPSANRSGEPAATDAGTVGRVFGDALDLLIDAGPTRYGKSSTVVRVTPQSWEMLREGAIPRDLVAEAAARTLLFVCTGNTCRSPLAQVFCKKLLADKLRCTPDELPQRGWFVFSAGLAAMTGDRATPEAVGVARELGADLENHVSRPLSPELVIQADDLVTMTRSHAQALVARFGQWEPRPRLLSQDGEDIADPIGGGEEIYRDCARQILRHVEALVAQFLPRE